jgi:leucyl-tRNA synthetase
MATTESPPPYDFRVVESRWQREWEREDRYGTRRDPARPKYFVCDFFPTPNGPLHMGHGRVYTLGDVQARYKAQRGFDVLHPMAFDSFGLPIEVEAVKTGVHPLVLASDYAQKMAQQLRRMGYATSYRSTFSMCEPRIYRWTQFLFTRLLEHDLAYRKEGQVSYCPRCNTSLAHEQVQAGACWRCDTPIEHRYVTQWYYRITRFAQELLDGLTRLPGWPEFMRKMQVNWIGRSEGAHVDFPFVDGSDALRVFTTRIDALYGTTFIALSPVHPLARRLCDPARLAELGEQREQERDRCVKKGFRLERDVRHPLTGAALPVYVANYVQGQYGCGAVAGVPGHDARDAEFADLMNLPSIWVTQGRPLRSRTSRPVVDSTGTLVDSGPFSGLTIETARARITQALQEKGLGKHGVEYRLHDWCISRQRYWGTPIPVVHCEACGTVPLPAEELPLLLPLDVEPDFAGNPLARSESFVRCRCPRCQRAARRETDTMDTYCDSCWYIFRTLTPGLEDGVFDPRDAAAWLPVDVGVGGVDAINFLLYTRFMCKAMGAMGMLAVDEPITDLIVQRSILSGGQKMSKRSKNVVAPDEIVEAQGADCFRVFITFLGAPGKSIEFEEKHLESCKGFLNRLWDACQANIPPMASPNPGGAGVAAHPLMAMQVSDAIASATAAYEKGHFNVVVQNLQGLLRTIEEFACALGPGRRSAAGQDVLSAALLTLCRLLTPIAPHITHEIWQLSGQAGRISDQGWPTTDAWRADEPPRNTVVQIDGVKQFEVLVQGGLREEAAREFLKEQIAARGLKLGTEAEFVFIRRARFDVFNVVEKAR